jgi:RHS repeat-associated protein
VIDLNGELKQFNTFYTSETGQPTVSVKACYDPERDYFYLNGEPLALREYETNPGTYYYLHDHLGTPQQLVKADGTAVWKAAYLPYGQAQVQLGTVTNNLRFPGQYFDPETGLHYNWHRFYDPETGRYLSADPIGLDGGMNLYNYTSNNPMNAIDPKGLFEFVNPVSYWKDTINDNIVQPAKDMYDYAHQRRTWGHQVFGGQEYSSLRHCVTSCLLAANYNSAIGRVAGTVNELQGLVLHDIPNLPSRLSGRSNWAFQLEDFQANEKGFDCSKDICENTPETDKVVSCVDCCRKKTGWRGL